MNNLLRRAAPHRDRLLLLAVLVASTFAALAMQAFRVYWSGSGAYLNLVWNLFLAWLPFWFALPVFLAHLRGDRTSRARTLLVLLPLGFLWLLFFPNAPYLVTDFVHLHPQHRMWEFPIDRLRGVSPARPVPPWYDVVLLTSFAWNGLLLGFISLHMIHRVVRDRVGAAAGWAMVVVVMGLTGFGISLGRFLRFSDELGRHHRWNSWDLFYRPTALLSDVADRVLNPLDHPRTTAVTVLFSGFLLLAYLTLVALIRTARETGADSPTRRDESAAIPSTS